MRIAINCRSIMLKNRTGIGRYTYHLIEHLGKVDTQSSYRLYSPKRLLDLKRHAPTFPYHNFKTRVDCFGLGPGKVDIYHLPCPDVIAPFQGKLVVTIHDLIHKTYPQAHTPQTVEATERHMQNLIKHADRIICTSQSTRNDLHRFYDYPQERSKAVLSGVDHATFNQLADKTEARAFLNTFGMTEGFILFVGTIEPRKNLQGLLQALTQLKAKGQTTQLVVVGMRGWMMEEVSKSIEALGLKDNVHFAGFVSDAQLNMLYNTCGMFVFPSFYEGFGFPILEAFCAGAPVITSNVSSCPEIAGDAALLIDPADPSAIAGAISRLIDDKAFADDLGRKGLARAKEFNFTSTAQKTLEVYRSA